MRAPNFREVKKKVCLLCGEFTAGERDKLVILC